MNKHDIVGTWEIVKWEQRYDDGRISFPMGESPTGLICYEKERFFVVLARRGRPHFESGGQWSASDAEKARAYDSFMSYTGRYSVNENEIIHSVEISLFPNWEGGEQHRRVALHDGSLELSARLEDGTPEARTAIIQWKRASSHVPR